MSRVRIKELRRLTQDVKIVGRERPWGYRLFQRGPSIYITTLVIRTPVTPNQISFLMIIAGIGGAIFFLIDSYTSLFLGLGFFYLNILLDKVDGEVARFKNIHSLRGIFLDEINHLVIPPLFFISLTYHLASTTPISLSLFWFSGAVAAINMSFIRTGWSLAPQIYAKKYAKRPDQFAIPKLKEKSRVEKIKEDHKIISRIAFIIHQLQEFFSIIFIFFLAGLIQAYFTPSIPLLHYLILFYSLILTAIFIENSIKGYLSIEHRIARIHQKLK